MTGRIGITRALTPTTDVGALVDALNHDLAQHYAPEQQHGLALEAIFQPSIRFFVATLDGEAVGCGGIALCDGYAEIKRMYVRETARRSGVADALMARLEAEARSAGLARLLLETGNAQVAALDFYRRCGFVPTESFGPYAALPPHSIATSIFMEKRLG